MNKLLSKIKGPISIVIKWPLFTTIFLMLVNIPLYFFNLVCGIVVSGSIAIYLIFVIIFCIIGNRKITKEFIDFASDYAQMQKKLLDNFTIPYGLLDEAGYVIWLNKAFNDITNKNCYGKTLGEVFDSDEFEFGKMLENGAKEDDVDDFNMNITYNGKDYRLLIEKTDLTEIDPNMDTSALAINGKDYVYALYMFDETEMNKCKKELHDERFVCGVIYIDNYDEAIESIEEARRALLTAYIDRRVNKYIVQGGGIVKKLEKDKYLVSIRYKYLEQLREERFSILEEVKGISVGNEIPVTLSIGIGVMQGSFEKNFEAARAAIDLALGRGGDQAVVREKDKVTYYGGKTNASEKKGKVKARVKANALREFIENADNVLIMGHKISDIDALGAAIGIFVAARMFGKKANIILNEISTSIEPFVNLFKNNPDYEKDLFINNDEVSSKLTSNTLLVVVDVNKASYTECPSIIGKCKNTYVVDHHRQGNDAIDAIFSYVEPSASSACEMVAELLQYVCDKIKIKQAETNALLAGMIIDTNNFAVKTGVRTFEAAAFVKRCGADITKVRKLLRSDMNEYKAKAEAVSHAEVYNDSFAFAYCRGDGLVSPTIVGAQAANELLEINNIKASFVFTEYNGEMYISARSIDEVNVQLVMERLGGGGHMTVAGTQLKINDYEQAKEIVKKVLDEMLKEGAI